jgi:hypothetical protein
VIEENTVKFRAYTISAALLVTKPIISYHLMETFLNIPLETITASGNNILHWEGVVGDILISISARKVSNTFHYIVYVELCGYPEKWWPGNRFKIAEAAGENIKILEIEIRRQLQRLKVNI